MDFNKQLDFMHEHFVKGVRATLRYQFEQTQTAITDEMFNHAVKTVLISDGWSEKLAEYWANKP